MFKTCKASSPVAQDLIWMAEYDNNYLSEFDLETKQENSFYDIDKNELKRFGLLGAATKCGLNATAVLFIFPAKKLI